MRLKANAQPQCFELRAVVAATLVAVAGGAQAFEIKTDNPDVTMRWDNTVRYNAGWRMEDVNPHFANSFGNDETENTFGKHDMVTNRADLLSEFDFVYQGNYGFRVSGAAWSENAYGDGPTTGPLIDATFRGPLAVPSNYGPSRQYSPYAKRYMTGSSGEILDAFVFGNFELGSTSLKVKAGQHNVYWGESLYSIGDSIATGQAPIDTIKASASPGSEAKELFLPLPQVSAQWQLASTLSLSAQYLFDWEPARLVPGGTYFAVGGNADGYSAPCSRTAPGGTCMSFLSDITPQRKRGDYGLALRWSPDWVDGTLGAYYRRYDEKLPWYATQFAGGSPANPRALGTRLVYAQDTELFGVSLTKNIAGVSMGMELSYRKNTALNSVTGYFVGTGGATPAGTIPAAFAAATPLTAMPGYLQSEGARGNTFHALVNGVWLLPRTPLWEGGTLQGELTYQRLASVSRNANLFYSEDYACKTGYALAGIAAGARNKDDGCANKDAWGLAVGFTPEWPQAFAGWDISMPISYRVGLKGNSPALGGALEGVKSYSIGVKAKYHGRYEFGLAYNDAKTPYKVATAAGSGVGPTVSTQVGSGAVQNNHGWLSLTFKSTF